MSTSNTLLLTAVKAAIDAGGKIQKVYHSEKFYIEHKEDNSPLTLADKESHEIIKQYLEKTNIPILSEEGKHKHHDIRKNWQRLWIVDPLDGTKEFIKRNGEFTVNIALVENGKPLLGVIYAPEMDVLYFAEKKLGAYKFKNVKQLNDISAYISESQKLPVLSASDYTVVASRSHMSEETKKYIDEKTKGKKNVQFVSMGSSLKICLVAEGYAQCYPRFAPTMEWDTAAGQAIAEAAGKKVIDYITQKPMLYNKENLLNNWFVVE